MTNQEISLIAMGQSAIDSNCDPGDFLLDYNKTVISRASENARKYLELPFACDLVSYGNHIVASVRDDLMSEVKAYIDQYPPEHCFETPNLYVLNEKLQKYNLRICFMAEYFLPDAERLKILPCPYELGLLMPEDFAHLYQEQWSNALCEKRRALDVLAVGAYDQEKLIGLAGCSADCDTMWQIGVDVLPEYRCQGVASSLTSRLALEILERGKVPFYCAAWSNIKSVRNAVKSGFRPAWVEVTAKSIEFIDEMNQ